MVKLAIQVKFQNEKVTKFSAGNQEDFRWHVKLEANGTETDKFVYISQDNEIEISGSKNTAHHVQKINGKEVNVTILEVKSLPDSCVEADFSEFRTLAVFECRGCTISDFFPSDGWVVKSEDGTEFEDVDMTDEWYDVDNSGESVSITEFEFQIVKVK